MLFWGMFILFLLNLKTKWWIGTINTLIATVKLFYICLYAITDFYIEQMEKLTQHIGKEKLVVNQPKNINHKKFFRTFKNLFKNIRALFQVMSTAGFGIWKRSLKAIDVWKVTRHPPSRTLLEHHSFLSFTMIWTNYN